MTTIDLKWELARCDDAESSPTEFIPATVPGAVQLDWAAAHDLPDYTIGDNVHAWADLDTYHWRYRAAFSDTRKKSSDAIIFHCLGIDYAFEISVNGQVLHSQEGMFTPINLDLTEYMQADNILEILIFPAPRKESEEGNSDSKRGSLRHLATDSCKPACAYGWDWHPVLIPLGIWDACSLQVRSAQRILDTRIEQYWEEDAPLVAMTAHSACAEGQLQWMVRDPQGEVIIEFNETLEDDLVSFASEITDPQLWWPRGYGEQHLYSSELVLSDAQGIEIDRKVQHFGVRKITMEMHPTAWSEPEGFPKTRSTPPMVVTVNGEGIFVKGSNWVPPDIFPGRITDDTYAELIDLACEANFNTLRVWGGGIVNKDAFYQLCDQRGILVFCEFPLACNPYGNDPHYLKILEQEAISIVSRYQHHPKI
ncbi:MAG: hypothetical protein HRU15_05455, partial [Planctomycetes bacterium]|nr:hypothetical protein [Planctomycetota bacterium]